MLHLFGNQCLGCVWQKEPRFVWCRGGGRLCSRPPVKIDLLPDPNPNHLRSGSAAAAAAGSSPLLGTLLGDKCNGLEEERRLPELSAG